MTDFATYIGTFIGLIGIVVGYWQNRQRASLEKVVRANSWINFQRANNSSGQLQLAFRLYKEKHAEYLDIQVVEELSKSDAFSQEVFKESVRQIHFSEKSFTINNIEMWVKEGKISEK